MADGDVYIDVGANVTKAEKALGKLYGQIQKIQEQLKSRRNERDAIAAQMDEAAQKAEVATRKIKELKAELANAKLETTPEIEAAKTKRADLMEQRAGMDDAEYNKIRERLQKAVAEETAAREQINDLQRNRGTMPVDDYAKQYDELSAKLAEAKEKAQALREELRNTEYSNISEQIKALDQQISTGEETARKDYEEKLDETNQKIKEQQQIIAEATKESEKLNGEWEKLNQKVEEGEEKLSGMKEEAGEMEREIERARPGEAIAQSLDQARASLKKFMKYAIGIRSTYILFRRLKAAIKDSVSQFAKHDPETKKNLQELQASLAAMKVSWGAAFAPVLNFVMPALKTLIGWLTAAANAVAKFFALLSGKSSYKKAIANTAELEKNVEGVGAAAAEAKKQLMGFDELNILSDNSGSGGSGGKADGIDVIEEQLDALDDSFIPKFVQNIKDVLFNWDDLNEEQISKKWLAGLGGFLGAALGLSLGFGPGGVLLLTATGVIVSLLIDNLLFNNDGKLSDEEWHNVVMMLLNGAIGGIAGIVITGGSRTGAIVGVVVGAAITLALQKLLTEDQLSNTGFIVTSIVGIVAAGIGGYVIGNMIAPGIGGVIGAVIGLSIGLAIQLRVEKIRADNKHQRDLRQEWENSDIGQQVTELKARIAEDLQANLELRVRISGITGEVDDKTLADLRAAQALVERIFYLDEKPDEQRTPEMVRELQSSIEVLNSMGLPDLQLEFDETTGHVIGTREEVDNLINDLLRQYRVQALGEAYGDAYLAQAEAYSSLQTAVEESTTAINEYNSAVMTQTQAQDEYNAALAEYKKYSDEIAGAGAGGAISDVAQAASDRLAMATHNLELANQGVDATRAAAEEAYQLVQTTQETYNLATQQVEGFTTAIQGLAEDATQAGLDAATGFAEGITDNSGESVDATTEMAQANLNALQTILDSHSPSKETAKQGKNFIDGFIDGIEDNTAQLLSATEDAMQQVLDSVTDYVDKIKAVWGSDWGRPMIHVPAFSLWGNFDLSSGAVPQVGVSEWIWMAKGGIVNGLTPIIAGEAGKEAVLPLERNTGWIKDLAEELMAVMESKYSGAMRGRPAMASGTVVPPMALSSGNSGGLSDLASAIGAAIGSIPVGGQQSGSHTTIVNINGKEFYRATYDDFNAVARERGVSLTGR